jgi:hypothetical protein
MAGWFTTKRWRRRRPGDWQRRGIIFLRLWLSQVGRDRHRPGMHELNQAGACRLILAFPARLLILGGRRI